MTVSRPDPPLIADERRTLQGFLDYQRATLVWKASGLTREQATITVAASSLTMVGLVKHLALVEEHWVTKRFLGLAMPEPWASAPFDVDPDWEFHSAAEDDLADVLALYETTCDRSNALLSGYSLDDTSAVELQPEGSRFTLRWMLLHLVEETARHNGHADLLREAADGATGE